MVSKAEKDGSVKFVFNSREDARYVEGVESPDLLREALEEFPQPTGISEILEGSAVIDSVRVNILTEVHGIRIEDHILASNLENQIIRGKVSGFAVDESACLVGSRVADRLRLQLGDRVMVRSGTESRQFRIVGVFETGVSQIDKKRIFLHHSAAKTLFGRGLGRTIFQLSIKKPEALVELAHQMQLTLGHRVISWQEREKVWLEVFQRSPGLFRHHRIEYSPPIRTGNLQCVCHYGYRENKGYCHTSLHGIHPKGSLRSLSMAGRHCPVRGHCSRMSNRLSRHLWNLENTHAHTRHFLH